MHLKIWPEVSAKLFQCQFLGYGWTNQSIHYMVFCRQKIPNKDLSWSKSEIVYTRLYLNKLESIMRALSNALPTGHRAMANPTLQLHFGCGRATAPVSHFSKLNKKVIFLPKKTQKLILTLEWYYRSLYYCRSNAMNFLKKWPIWRRYHLLPP